MFLVVYCSSPRARGSRHSPSEDEALSRNHARNGADSDIQEEGAPGSPLPSVVGNTIISPLRIGTARSDAEAAAELDAFGDALPEGRGDAADDAHGFPEVFAGMTVECVLMMFFACCTVTLDEQ
jgi:hypothetical protein